MGPEPGTERRWVTQRVETLPRGDQRVLDRVRGIRVGTRQDLARSQRDGQLRLNEPTERIAVAPSGGGDEHGDPGRLDR